jgi:uncharacterized protein
MLASAPYVAARLGRTFLTFLLFCPVLMLSAQNVSATADRPSFTCSANVDDVAKAVCSDPELSQLDVELSAIYTHMRADATVEEQKTLLDEQRKWLATGRMHGCPKSAPIGCLRDNYRTRINALKAERESLGIDDYASKLSVGHAAIINGVMVQCNSDKVVLTFNVDDQSSDQGDPDRGDPNIPPTIRGRGVLDAAHVDCHLAAGTTIRVKSGYTSQPMPYGMCGASPSLQLSVWVNQRKVISRLVFTDYCETPFLESLSINTEKATYCLAKNPDLRNAVNTILKPTNGSCDDIVFQKAHGIDRNEFAAPGTQPPHPGTLTASGDKAMLPVCKRMITHSEVPDSSLALPDDIQRPDWHEERARLPQPNVVNYPATLSATGHWQSATFDLANTGTSTMVYMDDENMHVFDGTAFGMGSRDILVKPYDVQDWKGSLAKGIYAFVYSHATPFFYDAKTYILLQPTNAEENPTVAILHGNDVKTVCTFDRVQEDF